MPQRRGYVGGAAALHRGRALESESTYEQGKLARRKSYKDGKLVLEEEYFDDGSRKSTRKVD